MVQQSVMGFDIDLHRHGPFVCMYPVCICLCVVCAYVSPVCVCVCVCVSVYLCVRLSRLKQIVCHTSCPSTLRPTGHVIFFRASSRNWSASELLLGFPPFSELIKIFF